MEAFDWQRHPGLDAPLNRAFALLSRLLRGLRRDGVAFDLAQPLRLGEYLDLQETPEPPTPPADTARVFARDSGTGKVQVCIKYPSGAVVALSTEP